LNGINGTNIKKLFSEFQIAKSPEVLIGQAKQMLFSKKAHCKRLQERLKKMRKEDFFQKKRK
jgi:hypothetical protein